MLGPGLERIAIFRGDISRILPEPEFLSSCKQNRFAPQLSYVSFRWIETRIFFELQRVDRKWARSERVCSSILVKNWSFKGWPISFHTRDSSCNNSLYFVIKWLIKSIFLRNIFQNLGKDQFYKNPKYDRKFISK